MTETSVKNSTLIQNNVSFKNNVQDSSTTTNNTSSLMPNNGNNANTNNNGPKHHFRHHNIISHNQFIRQDVKEVSLLDSLKSNIIDDSPIRKSNYIPEKVYVRTDLCLLTGDQQEIAKEKERRKKVFFENAIFFHIIYP